MFTFKVIMRNGWEVIIPIHAESIQDAWFDVTIEALKCANDLKQTIKKIGII